jgi:hypothetical protein
MTNMVRNDKLYFPAAAPLNGDTRLGVWVCDENGKLALDFYEPTATSYDGIFATANLWWIAHSGNGLVSRFDDDGAYSTTSPSIWESLILSTVSVTNRGTIIQNNAVQKKLLGVTVRCEPLPNAGQIVLKYRKDTETAWTTIFTYAVAGGMGHSAINIEADESNLPTYNEIQFRVESTGGAVFLGLEYGGETLDNDLY